jgi:hypothetical protein
LVARASVLDGRDKLNCHWHTATHRVESKGAARSSLRMATIGARLFRERYSRFSARQSVYKHCINKYLYNINDNEP